MRYIAIFVHLFAYIKSLDCIEENDTSVNHFDVDLLRYSVDYKSGNVMVSPASIRSILATVLEGADGSTATEIKTVLRLLPDSGQARDELKEIIRAISEVDEPGITLENYNGLFMSKSLTLTDQYNRKTSAGSDSFVTHVHQVDFKDPDYTMMAMNRWVNEKTRGHIYSIINKENITPSTKLMVVNAIYFQSKWRMQFPIKYIHADCFYKNNQCKTVAMMDMQTQLNYTYVESLRAHAVELPYQNKRYTMLLVVPKDPEGIIAVLRDLAYVGLRTIINTLKPANVYISLPKFTITYKEDMVAVLKAMGIRTLFTPTANLSRIIHQKPSKTKTHLNNIFHSIYMDVNEEGATATSEGVPMVVPLTANQFQLRVDRPFIFFILDIKVKTVLFEGMVEDPAEYFMLDGYHAGGLPKRSIETNSTSTNTNTTALVARTSKKPIKRSSAKQENVFKKISDWFSSIG